MSLIKISNLTFCHEGSHENIFESVNFQIDTDWRLGFTGRNGRGKTTFLNLLMGKYEYTGTISHNELFSYFPFDVEDSTEYTIDVATNINTGIETWELERELSLLEVDSDVLYRPFETLSKGEQTKVMLAVLFLKDNDYLLIDEPTNHLDSFARRTVSEYLKTKKGFILVSHDRKFLDDCIDHILVINRSDIEIQKGNFSSWWENKNRQDNFELAENEKLNKDIKRLGKASRQKTGWSYNAEKAKRGAYDKGFVGHKAAKVMKRAKEIEKKQQSLINDKKQLLKNIESADSLAIRPQTHHAKHLVTLEDISIYYQDKIVFDKISFVVERGDRVALSGKNGSGKSSIVKLVCGADIKYTGNFRKASNLSISYVSQDTSHLHGNLTEFAKNENIDESLFKAILRKLDFSRTQFEKDIIDFSEGQKKKVLIAKSLCDESHLYIWDEPLNYIDVLSRMQIEELLLQYKPTMIFVEHDLTFSEAVATKIIELS